MFVAALVLGLPLLMGTQCGDKCEALCQQTSNRLANCKPDSLLWSDLGANNRADFVQTCRQQWDRERLSLSASELAVALEFCDDTRTELVLLTCDELVALYAPTP